MQNLVLYGNRTILFKSFVSASFLHAFFFLVCVTLPSFSSFSLYVVPSFCRFLSNSSYLSARIATPKRDYTDKLSTFVLARFCRYCRCSSRLAAVFSVPRPFRSAFRASRCYLCAPFAFFLLLSALFNNHRKPAICPTAPRTART